MGRFQRLVGFDRAMALASTALTALIALTILCAPLLNALGRGDAATRIIERYSLTGGGAEAVRQLLTAGEETSTSILGAMFLLISILSFTRTEQRFFEQTWELKPLSVRNTPNALLAIAALAGYLILAGWVHAVTGDWLGFGLTSAFLTAPLGAAFLLLTGRLLSARRVGWTELLPFALAGGVLEAAYSVAAAAYLPRYFSVSASRYGPVGAFFAMVSTLFVIMLILVGCGALGREISLELARIRRGERPPEGEVRQEWDNLRADLRERWRTVRERWDEARHREPPDDGEDSDDGPPPPRR